MNFRENERCIIKNFEPRQRWGKKNLEFDELTHFPKKWLHWFAPRRGRSYRIYIQI